MTPGGDDRSARLYELALSEFTQERNALAAELRADGDQEGAAAVKALRKPSAAAWAVNQLVRAEPELVEALLGAGGELRQAHRQAASGKSAAQLRAAAEAERSAVEQLMARAPAVLGRAPSTSLAEAMRNTLHASSSDDDARERIASGTLETELRPVGLGPVPAALRERSTDAREARERSAELARERTGAAAAEATRRRELEAAQRALARADEAYTRARDATEKAAERLTEANRRLREARTGLRDAEARRARLDRD